MSSNLNPSPSRWRLVIYTAIAVFVFFGLVSAALTTLERLDLLSTHRVDDAPLYLHNDFIQLNDASTPPQYNLMNAQWPGRVQARFPAIKGDDVFRVFVTGGSFIRGGHHRPPELPAADYGTVSAWLGDLLELQYPSRRFEVINAGANGQASHRVGLVVDALLEVQPDLIVVATGNNEGMAPVTTFNQPFHEWIVYRLLKKTLKGQPELAERPDYPVQQLTPEGLGDEFQANLHHMAVATANADVPLVLATLPINLVGREVRPTQGEVDRLLKGAPECEAMEAHFRRGDYPATLDAAAQCTHPYLIAQRSAQALWKQGEAEQARELFKLAAQLRPAGRTRPSYNESIRRVAREHGLPLADVEAAFEGMSKDGLPGKRLFIDKVHLTCMGYLDVARVVSETIVGAKLISGSGGEPRPAPPTADVLAHDPWDALSDPSLTKRGRRQAKDICARP